MVEYYQEPTYIAPMTSEEKLDLIFHALSDQTRRKLLLRIAENECNVTELAEPLSMSLAAVSKHLKVLEAAGLLRRTIDGRVHRCKMDGGPLDEVTQTIAKYKIFWEDQLTSLEEFLHKTNKD